MLGAVSDEKLETLRAVFSGQLLTSTDVEYEQMRRVHNGLVDKRPMVIARCGSTADIVDAVTLGRDTGMEISVRGGGHNVAGKAVTDGGLMIDLSSMKGIHVDAKSQRVRAQGGVLWGEYNRAAHAYGLATTGGVVSTTGLAGLTLGGGVGWLMGKYGMAVDNVVSAEVVTAQGEIRTASAEEDADLFWAIRGAGANFGVVSSFEYQAHALSSVYGGLVAFDQVDAEKVFDAFAGTELPDELLTMCALVHAPDGSGHKIAALGACHCGEPDRAEKDLEPLRSAATPLLDMMSPMPYPVMNTILDDGYPRGARNYWKSAFFKDLSSDAIGLMVDAFQQTPSIMSGLAVERFHGQATRVGPTETAYPHRQPGYNLIMTSVWSDPADDEANIAWTRDTFAALTPHMADAAYVNYLDTDDDARVRAAYGPNWPRLIDLKRRYDPDNLFHLNLNIDPTSA
jgi:FAD/FMN-containing dehydrogenase